MSELYTEIKRDSIEFRKSKNPFAVKTTHLISTIDAYIKDNHISEITDDVIVKVVRGQLKKTNDLRSILVSNNTSTTEVDEEIAWLTKFLPVAPSETDIIAVLDVFFENNEKTMKSMGKAMAFLKEKFGNSLNPSQASAIVKGYLV